MCLGFAVRPQKRGSLLGTGGGGGGGAAKSEGSTRTPTRKTEEAVDRRQNNQNVKAVSPRRCGATSILGNCCLDCCAEQSHKENDRSTAAE